MVIVVDHDQDAYPTFPSQSVVEARSLLPVSVVALKPTPATKAPPPLLPVSWSADFDTPTTGINEDDAEARTSSEEEDDVQGSVLSRFSAALSCYPYANNKCAVAVDYLTFITVFFSGFM